MLSLGQSKKTIQTYTGIGAAPPDISWSPSREQNTIPRTEDVVRCNFDFSEQSGEGATATVSFPVEQITLAEKARRNEQPRRIDIFRILNADNEKATLPDDIERLVKIIAAERFLARGTVTATGYNDRVLDTYGNAAQNLALCKERAAAVAKALANVISAGNHVPFATPIGRAGKASIYPEFTPEGRMYSRMVEIRSELSKE
jgi:outer membrane protein OmpA-like peptidoglycan-associated protein